MKRTRMKARNSDRLARLRARQFGPQAELCRLLRCCVCGAAPPSDPEHVRARGMGGMNGKDSDTVPLCRTCHQLRHAHGHAGPWVHGKRVAFACGKHPAIDDYLVDADNYAPKLNDLARRFFEHVAAGLAGVVALTSERNARLCRCCFTSGMRLFERVFWRNGDWLDFCQGTAEERGCGGWVAGTRHGSVFGA